MQSRSVLIVNPEVTVVLTVPEKLEVLTSCALDIAIDEISKTSTADIFSVSVFIVCMNYSPNSHINFLKRNSFLRPFLT